MNQPETQWPLGPAERTTNRVSAVLVEHGPKIRMFFDRRTRNQHDIEDMCSEVSLAIVQGIQRFADRSSISTWIYGICKNVYSHHVYYSKRDRDIGEAVKVMQLSSVTTNTSGVSRLLSRLPEQDQHLYEQYYVEGYSVREIAHKQNSPEGTVKYQLHQLRARFHDLLA